MTTNEGIGYFMFNTYDKGKSLFKDVVDNDGTYYSVNIVN